MGMRSKKGRLFGDVLKQISKKVFCLDAPLITKSLVVTTKDLVFKNSQWDVQEKD
jgi:hypothetical protein